MKKLIPLVVAVASLSLMFAFGACSKPEEKAETAVESAQEMAKEAVEGAGAVAEKAVEDTKELAETVKEEATGGYGGPAHK